VSLGFTSVSYGDIDPTLFDFAPPPGVTVRDSASGFDPLGALGVAITGGAGDALTTRSFGRSWGSVVAIRMDSTLPDELTQFIPLSTPLLSARWASGRGAPWLLVGAVPQRTLATIALREFGG
jgi:hypothetical protein